MDIGGGCRGSKSVPEREYCEFHWVLVGYAVGFGGGKVCDCEKATCSWVPCRPVEGMPRDVADKKSDAPPERDVGDGKMSAPLWSGENAG